MAWRLTTNIPNSRTNWKPAFFKSARQGSTIDGAWFWTFRTRRQLDAAAAKILRLNAGARPIMRLYAQKVATMDYLD